MTTLDQGKATELVGAIYDAALDSRRWPAFMQELAGVLNAGLGILWMHDFSDSSADFGTNGGNVSASVGLDAGQIQRYADYYSGCNVWIPFTMPLAAGHVTITDSFYPVQRLKGTEFYNDWLRHNDLCHGVGTAIIKKEHQDLKLSFVRSEHAGPYSTGEVRLVRALVPHIRNAVALHQRLYRLESLSFSAMAALDTLPMGVALLTREGRLMHANRRAHELAAGSRALGFGASGAVHAALPAATARLQQLIAAALRTAAGGGLSAGGALKLAGANGAELYVQVVPLPAASSPFGEAAPVALFCTNPNAGFASLTGALKSIYGMTPAEADLAQALAGGQSLAEHAHARGVSLNTARTQLKSAAAKAGVKRQADLVRAVLTGPAVLTPSPTSLSK